MTFNTGLFCSYEEGSVALGGGVAVGTEDVSNQETHDRREQEHNTPDAKEQGDEGFLRDFGTHRHEASVRAYVVKQKVGKYKNGNGNCQRAQSQQIPFVLHMTIAPSNRGVLESIIHLLFDKIYWVICFFAGIWVRQFLVCLPKESRLSL